MERAVTRRDSRQLSLPMPVQRRRFRPEPPALWHGVVVLRRLGKRVYRAGRYHEVDGDLLDSDQLNRLVAAEVALGKPKRIAELCQP